MATRAIARSERESYLLVVFRHGDPASPTFERYTDFTRDVLGHRSTPAMEVDLGENGATFDDREVRIALPIEDDFTTQMAKPLLHSPSFVIISEITAGLSAGEAASNRIVFIGRVMRCIGNYQGRDDTAVFFCKAAKSRLNVPLGLQANHHCVWRLFGSGCQLIESVFSKNGQIAVIDGPEITISANAAITAPTSPGGNVDRYWERGYLEKDGLKIDVHIWKLTDPTKFVLRRRPPDSWLLAGSSSIKFVPGCHKTVEDCREVWDNEEHFGGFGYAIPAYNPIFEDPA